LSHKILSSLDTQNILDFILDTLKNIIDYSAAAIFLLDKNGKRLLNTGSRGYDTDIMNNLHLKVGQGACGWVVKTKQIDVLDDVSSSRHYIQLRKNTRSQASIPLIFEEDVLGVLCLESDQPAFFKEDRVDILRLFANQTAIALHNARQVEVQTVKQAFEHELINAGKVQQGLLPRQIPQIGDLKIVAFNIPSKIVSGDLYDITKLNESSAGLAIGDISGKGAPAALMMALILAGLRTQNKSFSTTCDLVYRLNDLLCQTTIEGKYATFFYAVINAEKESLVYTNGGHNPPLLFRATGEILSLTEGGIVLGFLPGYEYTQEETAFKKGDLLVAYTDGVTETLNAKEEEFGEARLISLISKHRTKSVHDIKEKIIQELKSFSSVESPADDITLILCQHL
jgi:sigma-B regulation protein RsbU (phosphoserine phosphatase)